MAVQSGTHERSFQDHQLMFPSETQRLVSETNNRSQQIRTLFLENSYFGFAFAELYDRPFPSSFCLCFKASLGGRPHVHFHANQTHFHLKSFVPGLVLK